MTEWRTGAFRSGGVPPPLSRVGGLAGIILWVGVGLAAAQAQGVCDRTPQVRDKLVEVTGASSCEAVTAQHLAAVGRLDLPGAGLTVLEGDDFDGLRNLQELRLNGNSLRELPEAIFSGLSRLQRLWLQDNALRELPEGLFDDALDRLEDLRVDPYLKATLFFQLTERKTVDGADVDVRVWLSRALPVAVRVPYTVGGTVAADDYTIPFSSPEDGLLFLAGERAKQIGLSFWERKETLGKTLVLTLGSTSRIGLRPSGGGIEDAPRLGAEVLLDRSDARGTYTVTVAYPNQPAPVCDRTPQVRDELMGPIAVDDCNEVTAAHLTQIQTLLLFRSDIDSLQAHDFSGLPNLRTLYLGHNSLSELPEEIFQGLINLEHLGLLDNHLTTLPEGVFRGLSSLRWLYMSQNSLGALPEGIFKGLGSLTELSLTHNALTALPEGIFSGLANLKYLWLQENALTTLPEGVFQGLNSLQDLYLYRNSLEALPPGLFSGLSHLRELWLWGNYLTSLPEAIFRDLASLELLDLVSNALATLPENIFSGLANLKRLNMSDPLKELPTGLFDDVLDTLGSNLQLRGKRFLFTYKLLTRTWRGELHVPPHLKASLAFASSAGKAAEGSTVGVPVTLSQALPVAVRVPYTVGLSGAAVRPGGLSPDPGRGLLFRAGETRREIAVTLAKDAAARGEQTLVLTLGKPADIGLRRSDGAGPDAPYLDTDDLLLRSEEGATHTLTVVDADPAEPDPFCLSLWQGAPCSTSAILPHVFMGPLGESVAATELVVTHRDPGAAECEAAVLFHRGTSPAPAVSFNGRYLQSNLLRATLPSGGARVLTLTAPQARELAAGALYVFTRSPCTADSLQVQGRTLLVNGIDGEIEEMLPAAGQSPNDWLGNGDCRRVTALFGEGRSLGLAWVAARPGQAAPAGTRLHFAAFDLKGNFLANLSSLEVSGSHQALAPGAFDQPAILQTCLDVPGGGDFRLALTAIGGKAAGKQVQWAPRGLPYRP